MRLNGNDLSLGTIVDRQETLVLPAASRDKHLYVCGGTGVGKSKFLENLIRQDILNHRHSRCGLLLIDPHGELYDNTVAWMASVPLDRPVIPIDLRRDDWIVSYNLLRQRQANASVVADNMVDAMAYVFGAHGTDQTPLFARWAGNLLLALYENRLTLADALHLLSDQVEVRRAMTDGLTDQLSRRDWQRVNSLKPKEFEQEVSSTVNRLQRFIRNENLRMIFGQPDVSLDLGEALEEGSIILVRLGREGARISKENADLFATLLLADLWTAAQERGKRKGLKPFYLYLDEFQRFLSPTIAENLDEARGFGLHVTMANQYPGQLLHAGVHGKHIYDSIMENASSKIVFRLTHEDNLKPLAQWLFRGVMDPDEVKHELYSTKVMEYREEYRTAYSRGTTTSEGGTRHSSHASGEGSGRADMMDSDGENASSSEVWNSYFADAYGETDSWSESTTETTTQTPTLVPVLGKELSHVQFRSLEEQLFRAMAVLFDQEQRQCVARLVGMKAPVSVFTPIVSEPHISEERVKEYTTRLLESLPFVLDGREARARVEQRIATLPDLMLATARENADEEPVTAKRRVR